MDGYNILSVYTAEQKLQADSMPFILFLIHVHVVPDKSDAVPKITYMHYVIFLFTMLLHNVYVFF